MKILTANIAMGLRGMDRLDANLRGLAAYHGWAPYFAALTPLLRGRWAGPPYWERRVSYMRSHENLEATFDLVRKVNADIVVLNEVLPEIHESKLNLFLGNLGYISVAYGFGAKYPDAHVATVVASRSSVGQPIAVLWPQTPHPGCGGGAASLRIGDLSIIGVHTALGGCTLWKEQVRAIAKMAQEEKDRGNDVVLAGDWNETEGPIFREPLFARLGLVSVDKNKTSTCPISLPKFLQRSLDHIFIPANWKTSHFEALAFGSDHLALLAELNI